MTDPSAERAHASLAAPKRYTFGSTAAIVTSVGLIVGFNAASVSKRAILSGLLIIAIADNLTDSLSIHIYQESEDLEGRAAFRATVTNFAARLVVALSFVCIVLAVPHAIVPVVAACWATALLAMLTYVLARHRRVSARREVAKHLGVAMIVVATSRLIGAFIAGHVGG